MKILNPTFGNSSSGHIGKPVWDREIQLAWGSVYLMLAINQLFILMDQKAYDWDRVAIFSLFMGVASVILFSFGLFPIVTIVVSIVGITRTKERGSGRWMAVVGLVSGILFTLAYAVQYGHIKL